MPRLLFDRLFLATGI